MSLKNGNSILGVHMLENLERIASLLNLLSPAQHTVEHDRRMKEVDKLLKDNVDKILWRFKNKVPKKKLYQSQEEYKEILQNHGKQAIKDIKEQHAIWKGVKDALIQDYKAESNFKTDE